jgi:hypothetical protein
MKTRLLPAPAQRTCHEWPGWHAERFGANSAEAARQDCAFVFIARDLEFAASRVGQKSIIRDYQPKPIWSIEEVPEETGFSEEVTTLILGSRRPILFVEGKENSLDAVIYRCCYSDWTVIPRGSCEEVLHSVVTMRRNKDLTRVTCSGVVDADDYQPDDIAYLNRYGVEVLPVSEIENLILLLPSVSRAIAESEGYQDSELEDRLSRLRTKIFELLDGPNAIDDVVARYCRRRIDRMLKKVDISAARTVTNITAEYARQIAAIDLSGIAQEATKRIRSTIATGNLEMLLAYYDNKSMLALAATHLKQSRLSDSTNWLARVLRNNKAPGLIEAIRDSLPPIQPQ